MLDKYFNILLVDDEPDVLAVSKLTLRRITLYGLPLRVHTAASKEEAITFLKTHSEGNNLALAIIDVVMETDSAGLELCQFVREELKNHILPLIIRTGQAGKAPEREVIDRYEITGYINKVEATEERLYSLIKAGVRLYSMTSYDFYTSRLLYHVIRNMRSAARFRQAVQTSLQALTRSENLHSSHAFLSTRFHAGTGDLEDEARTRQLTEQLALEEGLSLGPNGDKLVVSDNHMLINIEPTRDYTLPLQSVWTISTAPPPFVTEALYMVGKQLQVLMEMLARPSHAE